MCQNQILRNPYFLLPPCSYFFFGELLLFTEAGTDVWVTRQWPPHNSQWLSHHLDHLSEAFYNWMNRQPKSNFISMQRKEWFMLTVKVNSNAAGNLFHFHIKMRVQCRQLTCFQWKYFGCVFVIFCWGRNYLNELHTCKRTFKTLLSHFGIESVFRQWGSNCFLWIIKV